MPAAVLLEDDFLPNHAALFQQLLETVPWDESMSARRTASYGQAYNYSQMSYPACPLHEGLVPVAELLQQRLGIHFDNCLLNYYATGENTMGFHADDTADLRPGTGVAIVSLGSPRQITFRRQDERQIQESYTLRPGSLLYMDDAVQQAWQHAIRKQPEAGPRISLTWRAMRTK